MDIRLLRWVSHGFAMTAARAIEREHLTASAFAPYPPIRALGLDEQQAEARALAPAMIIASAGSVPPESAVSSGEEGSPGGATDQAWFPGKHCAYERFIRSTRPGSCIQKYTTMPAPNTWE